MKVRLERPIPAALRARLRGLEMPESGVYIFRMNHNDEDNGLLSSMLQHNRVLDLYIAEPTLEEEVTHYLEKGGEQ